MRSLSFIFLCVVACIICKFEHKSEPNYLSENAKISHSKTFLKWPFQDVTPPIIGRQNYAYMEHKNESIFQGILPTTCEKCWRRTRAIEKKSHSCLDQVM